jgi:hypothetical protein
MARGKQNLQSAGRQLAKSSIRHGSNAAVGIFKWAATDHSGMSQALDRMPEMGFIDTIKYTLMHFLIAVVGAVLSGIFMFVLIAYGIPFLIEFFISPL